MVRFSTYLAVVNVSYDGQIEIEGEHGTGIPEDQYIPFPYRRRMALSEEAETRLADVVALQPTKNAELEARWGMESGSEVHGYLEAELSEYYYRDENSLIRATADAAELVGADVDDGPRTVRVPELQARVFAVVANADEGSESVVSVLHKLRDAHDIDPATEDVRSALRGLARRGVVEVVQRTVPTFRLKVERDNVIVEALDSPSK